MILTLIFAGIFIICLGWVLSHILLRKYYEHKGNKYRNMSNQIYDKYYLHRNYITKNTIFDLDKDNQYINKEDAELCKEYRRLACKYSDLGAKFEVDPGYKMKDFVTIATSIISGLILFPMLVIISINNSPRYIENDMKQRENTRQSIMASIDHFEESDFTIDTGVVALTEKIEAWNRECIDNKYYAENPWTSWFYHDYNLAQIDYAVIGK